MGSFDVGHDTPYLMTAMTAASTLESLTTRCTRTQHPDLRLVMVWPRPSRAFADDAP